MRLRAFAKINLDLRVLPLRPDGYHDLATTFQTLALHDVVTVTPGRGGVSVACDDPRVPEGDGNLCARAVRAMAALCGRAGEAGVSVHVEKRIPVSAGLGGGSADAAATILGVARLWDVPATDPRLHEAAARVGADVAFLLTGGTALGTGRGDVLTPLRDLRPLEVVLVQPPFGVSTAEAYRWFDELAEVPTARGGGDLPVSSCRNDLEPPVVMRHPEIHALNLRLRAFEARQAAMSGSGSVVFGLFDTVEQADRAAEGMRDGAHLVLRTRTVGRDVVRRQRFVEG